jgi:hypothetical protein
MRSCIANSALQSVITGTAQSGVRSAAAKAALPTGQTASGTGGFRIGPGGFAVGEDDDGVRAGFRVERGLDADARVGAAAAVDGA